MTTYILKKKNGYVLTSESGKEIKQFKNVEEAMNYIDELRRNEDCEIIFKR